MVLKKPLHVFFDFSVPHHRLNEERQLEFLAGPLPQEVRFALGVNGSSPFLQREEVLVESLQEEIVPRILVRKRHTFGRGVEVVGLLTCLEVLLHHPHQLVQEKMREAPEQDVSSSAWWIRRELNARVGKFFAILDRLQGVRDLVATILQVVLRKLGRARVSTGSWTNKAQRQSTSDHLSRKAGSFRHALGQCLQRWGRNRVTTMHSDCP
mmetsp:Transcript_74894/g.195032  ORF Transcript_74894/g.195032 Transcript_74894/m.195032 type:complete len:210 (-) Transcript_74894:870-1499(-)